MDNDDLKKLSRLELLEILYQQQQRIEDLEKEIDRLNMQVDEKQAILRNTGSIADASLALTNIFEEAQKAADIYLGSIKEIYEKALADQFIDELQMPGATKPKGRHMARHAKKEEE